MLKHTIQKGSGATIIAIFLIVISLPLLKIMINQSLRLASVSVVDENRNLAPMPNFTAGVENIRLFPKHFEAFFNDHYPGRYSLIKLNGIIKHKWLKLHHDKVFQGKDDWLFARKEGDFNDFYGLCTLDDNALRNWSNLLVSRRKWFASRGVHYLYVVLPNKSTLYHEFLPASIEPFNGQTRLDQFKAYLLSNSEFQILDLSDVLRSYKNRSILYHKNDTHWNMHGQWVGSSSIIRYISKLYGFNDIDMQCRLLPDFHLKSGVWKGDLSKMMAVNNSLPVDTLVPIEPWKSVTVKPEVLNFGTGLSDKNTNIVVFKNPVLFKKNVQRTILVFHDSFFQREFPKRYIAEHFTNSIFLLMKIEDFFLNQNSEKMEKLIQKIQPDIIMEVRLERWLHIPKNRDLENLSVSLDNVE